MGGLLDEWREYLPTLANGLWTSLALVAVSLAMGMPLGLLLSIGTSARTRFVRWPAVVLMEAGRAVPIVVLLQIAYYGLPTINLTVTSFVAAAAGLTWVTGAFASEMLRAGLGSVGQGQREAATALGLGVVDSYRTILIPQGVRVALPSLLNLAIQVFQGTALAFTIALPELMSAAYDEGNRTFRYLSVFALAGVMYAAIVIPAGIAVRRIEVHLGKHLDRQHR